MKEGNFSTSPHLNGGVRYKETAATAAAAAATAVEVEDRPLPKETQRIRGKEREGVGVERDRVSARRTMRLHNLPADGRSWSVNFAQQSRN